MFDLPCGVRLRGFRAGPSTGKELSDTDQLVALYNDTTIAPMIAQSFIVPRGPETVDRMTKKIEDEAEMFCMVESLPGFGANATTAATSDEPFVPQFLGLTALWAHPERGHRLANFGIALVAAAQNHGIGTAITKFVLERAFVHLNIHRVFLGVRADNLRAQAVYKRCGFVEEGREREAYWIEGGWKDYLSMGILEREWRALQEQNNGAGTAK